MCTPTQGVWQPAGCVSCEPVCVCVSLVRVVIICPASTHNIPRRDLVVALPVTDFPDYQRKLSLTDQCAAQFDGKDNYHQTAEWLTKFGILRVHWTLESMHGKNIGDALSNLPSNAITEAIRSGNFIFSGSRNVVLDLAKARATPAVAK